MHAHQNIKSTRLDMPRSSWAHLYMDMWTKCPSDIPLGTDWTFHKQVNRLCLAPISAFALCSTHMIVQATPVRKECSGGFQQ